ncbi:MAG: hypothetical protein WKG07_47920 [Hymenobacter sp.]
MKCTTNGSRNQIDFRDGAQIFANPNLDSEFLFGRGWSYGNELYLEKKTGKTTGWVGLHPGLDQT